MALNHFVVVILMKSVCLVAVRYGDAVVLARYLMIFDKLL